MKYVSYLRVSTKAQGRSGLGLEAQKEVIKHFTTDGTIIAQYVEVESGKDIDNRIELKKAIAKAKKENAFLIVAKLDRLSRDVEHIFKIKKQLGDLFKSCDLPNTDSLTLSIFAGLAQREREIIGIRTKVALAQKKKQGVKLGKIENLTSKGRAKGVKAIKRKALNNENNKRSMELISLYKSQGLTLEKIANKLNDNGFKTSTGKQFHKTTVSRLHKRFLELQNA